MPVLGVKRQGGVRLQIGVVPLQRLGGDCGQDMPCVDAEYLRHSPGCFLHGASSCSVFSLSLMTLPLSSLLRTPAQRPGESLSGMIPQLCSHVRHSRSLNGHFEAYPIVKKKKSKTKD